MAEPPVVNTSPLVFLARSNRLELLQLVGDEIIVPTAVAAEVHARGDDALTARALRDTPWLVLREAPAIPAAVQSWDLGPGESAVLAWALAHPGSEAIIDDRAGRRCADALTIPVRGTLGLVLIAKQRGLIAEARPVLYELRRHGMYLSDRVIDDALKLIGES